MELTRVTGGQAEQGATVVATGGDADLLSLLLGGDQSTGSAFPATLEAALAGGETAVEPIAVGDGEDGGDAVTLAPDDGSSSTDVALAAALALASALAGATSPTPDASADPPEDGDVVADAATVVVDATALALGTGSASAPLATTATTATSATTAASATTAHTVAVAAEVERQTTLDEKVQAATTAAAAVTAEKSADATAATESGSSDAKAAPATSAGSSVADLGVQAGREVAPTGETAKPARPHGEQTSQQGAGVGGDVEKKTPSFSSGAGDQRGLDLGSSERHPAFAAVEPPAHGPATTTAIGAPGDAIHVTRTENQVSGAAAPVTATTAPAATTREAATARVDRPLHHPGAIEARWGERVADAVRLSALRGGGEIRLQLEPEGLGHIDVRLHLQSDGVRAVIVAEHESTRALLTSQQHVLQDAFNRSDLRLSGFSVDVGSGGGAASFAHPDEHGQGGEAPSASATPPPPTIAGADGVDANGAPLANGRVSVRV